MREWSPRLSANYAARMPRSSPQTERLVEILEFLAADTSRQRSLTEIARMLQVEKPTCYPMLSELVKLGWLVRHPQRKTYQLGPRLVPIGEAAKGAIDVVDMARPALAALADELGVACAALIMSGSDLVVAELMQPKGRRRGVMGQQIGDRVAMRPPLAGVFLAWADDATVDEWLSRDQRSGDDAAVRAHYLSVLAAVRERGFGVEQEIPGEQALGEQLERRLAAARGQGRARMLEQEQNDVMLPEMAVAGLETGRTYIPFSINATVFDSAANPVVAVCAYDFRETLTADEVAAVGRTVRAAANQVTAAMFGVEP